jgi:hypothetical protein
VEVVIFMRVPSFFEILRTLANAYPIRTPIMRTDPDRFRIGPRIGKNPKQRPNHSADTNPEYPGFFTGLLIFLTQISTMTRYVICTFVYLKEDTFGDLSAFEIPKLDLHVFSYILGRGKLDRESDWGSPIRSSD